MVNPLGDKLKSDVRRRRRKETRKEKGEIKTLNKRGVNDYDIAERLSVPKEKVSALLGKKSNKGKGYTEKD
jgi:hypothetical protein